MKPATPAIPAIPATPAAQPPRRTRIRYLLHGVWRTLACTSHGDPHAPAVLCVHGLTRVGADFNALAATLAPTRHVVLPDLPGRGASDWLDPPSLYTTESYVAALAHLLAHLDGPIDFVGTSLGGICGMAIAALPGQPIRRLVLNDIGPFVPAAALARLRDYLAAPPPRFADVAMLKTYLRRVHAPFGNLTDTQWLTLATHSARPLPDGSVALHYDPAIAETYTANPIADLDMWPWWNAMRIPVLTLRGATSDLLTEPTFAAMQPRSRTHTVPDAGHAPALLDPPTLAVIADFLLQP